MAGQEKKSVVVVGGGIAGALLARRIQNIANVTLIDPKEYLEIPMASMRAMVEPSLAERSVINYSDFLTEVQVVTSAATKIMDTEVVTAHGHHIPYDYLVVATGHVHSSPVTRDDCLLVYQEALKKIESANSILVIGGGPSGVELAGEISDQFPDKKVTLVHRGSRLLEFIGPKAGQKAREWLAAKNVEVIVDQTMSLRAASNGIYQISSGETISADLYFDCTGKLLGSSWLRDTILKGSLDVQGRLAIDEHLRVRGFKNIFAIGDITNIQEIKQGRCAKRHADVTAKNLKWLLGGGSEAKLSVYRPGKPVALVSLGRKEAVGQISCFNVSGRFPGFMKSRDLYLRKARKSYGLKPYVTPRTDS